MAVNKKKAPNGMYSVNILLVNKGKRAMAEDLGNGIFRVWSNSSSVKNLPDWKPSDSKEGWHYKDVKESDLTFFDF